jgi:hypothetical protein
MKKMKTIKHKAQIGLFIPLIVIGIACLFTGCQEKEENPSLYDASYFHNGATPVIDTVIGLNGDASKLASIARLKLTGKNFSTNPADNLVNFNETRGTVLTATQTELTVLAPNYSNDSLYIRVEITGGGAAVAPSNKKFYPLAKPLIEDKVLSAQELPAAMVCDAAGSLFLSLTTPTGGVGGVVKLDAAGNKTILLTAGSQQQVWKDVKLANSGNLYFAGPLRAIKLLRNGGTALENFAVFPAGDGISTLNALDFDANLNLWTGGESASNKFYSVTNTSPVVITPFQFVGVIKAMRVFNGYLYIGGKNFVDSTYKIYRYEIISNTQLGAQQVYYNFAAQYPKKVISSLTFSQDGYLYVGINDGTGSESAPGIVLIAPNGASAEDYYSGALVPSGSINNSSAYLSLMWGPNKEIYAARLRQYTGGTATAPVTVSETKLVKINALKNGAVYYGR